jgi:hypothetical protein
LKNAGESTLKNVSRQPSSLAGQRAISPDVENPSFESQTEPVTETAFRDQYSKTVSGIAFRDQFFDPVFETRFSNPENSDF